MKDDMSKAFWEFFQDLFRVWIWTLGPGLDLDHLQFYCETHELASSPGVLVLVWVLVLVLVLVWVQ